MVLSVSRWRRLPANVVRTNDEDDALLSTRGEILRFAGVALGQGIQMLTGPLFTALDDLTATDRYRYGFFGSAMANVIRGSLRTFLSFRLSRTVFTNTCSPSKSTHVGVTCGDPSGSNVPTNANDGFSKRSRYSDGMDSIQSNRHSGS